MSTSHPYFKTSCPESKQNQIAQAPTSKSSFYFIFVLFFCCCCHLRLFSIFYFSFSLKVIFSVRPQNLEAHIKGCMLLKNPITLQYFASQPLSVPKILQVKDNASEYMVLVYLDIPMQKNKVRPLTPAIHKVNSRGIIDLSVRGRTAKLLKENISINICDLGLSNSFFIQHQNHTQNKRYIGLTKIKIVGAANDDIKKLKRQSTELEKIFANSISDRDLYPEYIELIQFNNKKANGLI